MSDYDKFITPNLNRVKQGISTKDFNPPTIADREEKQAVQKLVTNDSSNPIILSAIGIGLLSLATMLGIRLRRRLQPATVLASSSGLGPLMPINTVSAIGDNVMEMKSQGPNMNYSAAVLETRPALKVKTDRVGWGQLSSQNSHSSTLCYAGTVANTDKLKQAPALESPPVDSTGTLPKVNGGIVIGTRKLAVVTGASSGLGLYGALSLAKRGDYYVVLACRNVERAERVAKEMDFPANSYTVIKCELGSFKAVRDFVFNLRAFKGPRGLDALVCNAAVYLPADPKPRFTEDGYEMSMGVNHLGHFLLSQLLLPDLEKARNSRCIIVGSITGNSNTIGGGLVYPRADLGNLSGLKQGPGAEMADGKPFFGAKAYKDSKVCNMMTVQELHRRYHDKTGITFSSLYPGCIAETGLFREKRSWFRSLFPRFMKYVTGGYVSELEAGDRLAQVVYDPVASKSGVYWSWNGNAQQVGLYDPSTKSVKGAGGSGGEIFENEYASSTKDENTAREMYEASMTACGLA
jgi:protochlorophyllide reductase